MTPEQEKALKKCCDRFETEFVKENYNPGLGMADGWYEGWIGKHIYVGISPAGEIHS